MIFCNLSQDHSDECVPPDKNKLHKYKLIFYFHFSQFLKSHCTFYWYQFKNSRLGAMVIGVGIVIKTGGKNDLEGDSTGLFSDRDNSLQVELSAACVCQN